MTVNILIVDDDPHIREVVQFALEKANMQTLQAKDGNDALNQLSKAQSDLIILDISMPGMDGLEFCKVVRKTSDVPILFLSSMDEEIDRVVGFEIGGDDYVTKPFSPRELVARVKAILKRAQTKATPNTPSDSITHGQIQMDAEQHTGIYNDLSLSLTATEFAILYLILSKPSRVFSRNDLLDSAYQDNINVSDRTIDSHIRNIRKKFNEAGCVSVIETVHGVGFKAGSCD